MREPIYKTRPVAPSAATFNQRCRRINDFIVLAEACSNVYLLETPAGNILVNSGMGFEAPVIDHNLKQHSQGDIKYLVTTQGHVDHLGGVQYFRDRHPGLVYIAQAGNPEHQAYDARLQPFRAARSAFRFQADFAEVFKGYAAAGYTDINLQDHPTPDQTFTERQTLELGGLTLELIAVPGAETNDSLVIWLPEQRIVLTGNLFGCPFGHFPNLSTIRGDRYRDALVCAAAAEVVRDLQPELLLYGHHDPVQGEALIRAELTAYRDAIHHVHDAVVAGMNAGKPLHQLQQEITLPAECEVGEGYGKVNWGVRAIWENYAGWFKHDSTTELYSVPRSEVNADLVALAGAAALVERAQERLDANEPEAALHLLDIVLGAQPDNPEAIDLTIRVHESLLQAARDFKTTGNFWFVGWLENQIKLLRGGSTPALENV
ncbi:alkyl sulfatase dimerization domain-containing protein [Parahaliea aestuarii]|uniref:MBL fold metallo-hydrolase n=1 Tax=Parahaliea aestuarii TaxID=1852021 RepID=A0A5C9A177_9GAMM|nr:alkyl sulfatase dimerization domain-containing protein [Parahaliea aestuarii]TXS94508.1 MBL fold metallo-hydrolase [Parahaliea aestuarii]